MPLPKFMNTQSLKAKANNREKLVTQQLNSGAFELYKGDMCTETDYIEHKHTDSNQYAIKTTLLEKMTDEAFQMGKDNAIIIIELPGFRVVGKVTKRIGEENG